MKSTRRFLVTAVASLLVALVVCAAWVFFRFQQYPIRLAEQELRTNLPHDLERIAHDEQWSWMGDGFSIWVYQLPTEVAADLVSRCESVGMRRGKLIEQSYRVTVPERYIDPEAEGCYAFKMHRGGPGKLDRGISGNLAFSQAAGAAEERSKDESKETQEPFAAVQGAGGAGGAEGGANGRGVGGAV